MGSFLKIVYHGTGYQLPWHPLRHRLSYILTFLIVIMTPMNDGKCAAVHPRCYCGVENKQDYIICEYLGNVSQVPPFSPSNTTYLKIIVRRTPDLLTVQNNAFSGLKVKSIDLEFLLGLINVEPGAFSGLRDALEYMLIRHTQIETLPDGIFNSFNQSLWYIQLYDNRLSRVQPSLFHHLTQLKCLYLSENKLKTIQDDTFSTLTLLEILCIDSNQLSTLNSVLLSQLTQLKQLHLNKNQLKTISADAFNALGHVYILHLQENQLSTLNSAIFSHMTSLRYLRLDHNKLETIPGDIFKNCKQLTELRLNDNAILSLSPDMFSSLSRMDYLSLANNSFVCDCHLAWLRNSTVWTSMIIKDNPVCLSPPKMRGKSVVSYSTSSCETTTSTVTTTTTKPIATTRTTTTVQTISVSLSGNEPRFNADGVRKLVLTCTSVMVGPVQITWLNTTSGGCIINTTPVIPNHKGYSQVLTIIPQRYQHQNGIQCRVRNTQTNKTVTSNLVTLDLVYAPSVHVYSTYSSTQNTRVVICEADGYPASYGFSSFTHYWGEKAIRTLSGQLLGVNRYVLTLSSYKYRDLGRYECRVTNGIEGPNKVKVQTGFVSVDDAIPGLVDETKENETVMASLGDDVFLEKLIYTKSNIRSHAWTNPLGQSVQNKWFATEVTLNIYEKHVQDVGYNMTLTIPQLQTDYFGSYVLDVCNTYGCAHFYISLEHKTTATSDSVLFLAVSGAAAVLLILIITVVAICIIRQKTNKGAVNNEAEDTHIKHRGTTYGADVNSPVGVRGDAPYDQLSVVNNSVYSTPASGYSDTYLEPVPTQYPGTSDNTYSYLDDINDHAFSDLAQTEEERSLPRGFSEATPVRFERNTSTSNTRGVARNEHVILK